MPNKKATFEAIATLDNNSNVQWELCLREPVDQAACGKTKADYPDIWLEANKGKYDFTFTITDQTNLGIKFAGDPLWIKKGSKPTGSGIDGQIEANTLKGQGTQTLEFVDKNSKPDKQEPNPYVMKYQLNFTDTGGNEVTSIDPDLTNGGTNQFYEPGGPGMFDPASSAFWMLLGAIFMTCLAANLLARLIKLGR